jgi:hypothetical protein
VCPCCSDLWQQFDMSGMPCPRGERRDDRVVGQGRAAQQGLPVPPGAGAGGGFGGEGVNGGGTNYSAALAGIDTRRGAPGRGGGRMAGGPQGGRGVGATSTSRPPAAPSGGGYAGGGGGGGGGGDAVSPPCRCGEPSVQRTVTKPGDNLGKVFFTCAKPRCVFENGNCHNDRLVL